MNIENGINHKTPKLIGSTKLAKFHLFRFYIRYYPFTYGIIINQTSISNCKIKLGAIISPWINP